MSLSGKNILVFTGGGLAPALNPTLYGVIKAAQKEGAKILGGFHGWASLTTTGKVTDLTTFDPTPIKNIGGTFLRSSRTNPFSDDQGVVVLKKKIKEHDVDGIVAIGGDDTLGAAERLFREENIPIVGIPKTIDNDLQATYWTPGYPTAAYSTAKYCYEIKVDAAYALSRVFVIEVLGRQSGWLTAAAAFGLADVIIPPEREVKLDDVLQAVDTRYKKNGNFATIVTSEEAKFDRDVSGMLQDANKADSYAVQRKSFVGMALSKVILSELGIHGKPLFPGNFMQTGNPIDIDAEVGANLGAHAVQLLVDKKYGSMASVARPDMSKHDLDVTDIPMNEAVDKVRFLDDQYFDFKEFRVTETYQNYARPFLGTLEERLNSPYRELIRQLLSK